MLSDLAFAFGCETASDIRLHYYAAADYTKNRKSGGIGKVDNSNGIKVQIMICDVQSYLIAMYYMLNFHKRENIILYWDEPTITLDLETYSHPIHYIIHTLWNENQIQNIVLSSATLPKQSFLEDLLNNFQTYFQNQDQNQDVETDDPEITYIVGYDDACARKSIRILGPNGEIIMPHSFFSTDSLEVMKQCLTHFHENPILLRYLDVYEIVTFITKLEEMNLIPDHVHIVEYFEFIQDLTLMNIKRYYLEVLRRGGKETYDSIPCSTTFGRMVSCDAITNEKTRFENSGKPLTRIHSVESVLKPIKKNVGSTSQIQLTTVDAHTLTDGPTIFLAENVEKLSKFYLQQSKIPPELLLQLELKLEKNRQLQKKLDTSTRNLQDSLGNEIYKEKKMEKESFTNSETRKIMQSVEDIRAQMVPIKMDSIYIPNTHSHQCLWVPGGHIVPNAFAPYLDELRVTEIMELDVDTQMKLLLLLGIGVFSGEQKDTNRENIAYMEIMKQLAQEQQLFLILASSDYIYGTNYQFCHAFLGKDLVNMTQQKILQAMGRVGRGSIQQDYTIRFRDLEFIRRLFLPENEEKTWEARNLCTLLHRRG